MIDNSKKDNKKENEIVISDNYKLFSNQKLGSGAFGDIYKGEIIKTKEQIAFKIEVVKDQKTQQLQYETKILTALQGELGIPKIYFYGSQGKYNILIMELLGLSLEDMFKKCNRVYTLKSTLLLANQIIDRIEAIHAKGFIHRDLKPDNIMLGKDDLSKQIYIIDFGLAKRYKDPKTGIHITYKDGKSLTGTARYASINTHLGIEQARRDDIEAFAYMIIYFLKGSLPWQGLKAKSTKEKYEKIKEMKCKTSIVELCKNLPRQVSELLIYSRELKFKDKPDYSYIKKLIKSIADKENISLHDDYDWIVENKAKEGSTENSRDSTKV